MDPRVIKEGNTYKQKGFDDVVTYAPDNSTTLLQLLQNRCKEYPDVGFLGSIVDDQICYQSFQTVLNKSSMLAGHLELITKDRSIVGICSTNRPEWTISEYATYLSNCINCPIYTSFSAESIQAVLNETELEVIIASGDSASKIVKTVIAENKYNLKHLILMDDISEEIMNEYIKRDIKVYHLNKILNEKQLPITRSEPKAEDIATICYTSGTSGTPKGVILTHKNFLSIVSVFLRNKNPNNLYVVKPDSVYASYLPLSHVLERICFTLVFASSAKVVFYRGNPKELQKDLEIIKPTFLVVVPRVLNVFKEKIEEVIKSKNIFVRGLFKFGLWYKTWLQKYNIYKSLLFDKLIFNKISAKFGGNIEGILCGAAAIRPDVLQFIQATLSCKIFLGYGQTEGLGANIVQPMDCTDLENVGIPFMSTMVKLEYSDEYKEGEGEILLKGPSITPGYYKRDDENKKTFTKDGWLKTGDLGVEDGGFIRIVGRVKEIFKTSFGEYIVPERLENLFICDEIEDIFITNSRFSDWLLAIVVSNKEDMNSEKLLDILKKRGNDLIYKKEINRYEIPFKVIHITTPFTALDSGNLITPTLKKRRNKLKEYFKDSIEEAYSPVEKSK